MKIASLFSLVFLTLATDIPEIQLKDSEEGICSIFPKTCPTVKQRKGVCCTRGPAKSKGYYDNFCLACNAVKIY